MRTGFQWEKQGLIFAPDGRYEWMQSHAQKPVVLVKDKILRVYFATRPQPSLSVTTFLDVDMEDPGKVLYVHNKPVLELGEPGTFDAYGIIPSCICEHAGKVWLYYGGWDRRVSVPHSNWTGLAISDDRGLTFRKVSAGPILDRTPTEIFSGAGCFVLKDSNEWLMWYGSTTAWIEIDGRWEEHYVIKRACSPDGVIWGRDNKPSIPSKYQFEATTCPSVLKKNKKYHMWFPFRGIRDFRGGKNSYRIGYAWSHDLEQWFREDDIAGIDVSGEGWDSEMIAYPYVVDTPNGTLMFYNGNGFGASGIGYALLKE